MDRGSGSEKMPDVWSLHACLNYHNQMEPYDRLIAIADLVILHGTAAYLL